MVARDGRGERGEVRLVRIHAGAAGQPQVSAGHGFQGFVTRALDDHDPVLPGRIGFHDGIDRSESTVEVESGLAEGFKILGAGDEDAVVISETGFAVVVAGIVIVSLPRRGAGEEDEEIVLQGVVMDFRCPDVVRLILLWKRVRKRPDLDGLRPIRKVPGRGVAKDPAGPVRGPDHVENPVVIEDRRVAGEVLAPPFRRGEDGLVVVEGLEFPAIFRGGKKHSILAVVAEVGEQHPLGWCRDGKMDAEDLGRDDPSSGERSPAAGFHASRSPRKRPETRDRADEGRQRREKISPWIGGRLSHRGKPRPAGDRMGDPGFRDIIHSPRTYLPQSSSQGVFSHRVGEMSVPFQGAPEKGYRKGGTDQDADPLAQPPTHGQIPGNRSKLGGNLDQVGHDEQGRENGQDQFQDLHG